MDNALKGNETSNYVRVGVPYQEQRYPLSVGERHDMPIDAEYNIVAVVGVAQDVTKAAKHDRAVASMARELRELVDTANAPIFGIDIHGNVNEWNDKTAWITGISKEEQRLSSNRNARKRLDVVSHHK